MTKRSRLGWTMLGAAALLLALLAFVALRQSAHWLPTRLTLPTAQTVILHGVSYGTNHVAPGSRFGRWLPAALRGPIQRFLRLRPLWSDRLTTEPKLVLWLKIQSGMATNLPANVNYGVMLADEAGRVAGTRENLHLWSGTPVSADILEFAVFPRRSREIRVLLTGGSYQDPQIVGELGFANPAYNAPADWEAELLPATRHTGDLECTIESLVTGVRHGVTFEHSEGGRQKRVIKAACARPGEQVRSALVARFRENGLETNAWCIGQLEVADATGNTAFSGGNSWSQTDATLVFNWTPALWPDDTWELRINAKRTDKAAFAPHELVEFKHVEIPTEGETVSLESRSVREGVSLTDGEFTLRKPVTGGSYSGSDLSELKFKVAGITNGLYLDLIRTVDDRGRSHSTVMRGYSSGSGLSEFSFGYREIPQDARRLTFTLAVHRGRPFTFRVKPELAVTNAVLFTTDR